ncbi:MAG TPA: hypothetical protein VGP92_07900 [Acidimicrobiia bacterium]|nr:hypothetical protein [Acidimicrobiia bacterium]
MTTPPTIPTPVPDEAHDELVPVEEIVPDRSLLAELRRRRMVTPMTRGLLVLVLAAGAFLGGVLVERSQAKSSPASALANGLPANIAARFGGRTASTVAGTGTAAAGASTPTFGTVKLVDGKNVYVTDAQGNVVKVATNSKTKISVSQDASVTKLKPSTSVIVQGTLGSDGTITATQISQSPAGGAGGGGFAGFGGGGARPNAAGG